MEPTAFFVIAVIAILAQSLLLFLALFEPGLDYKVSMSTREPLDSEDFRRMLEALTDARTYRKTRLEVLTNGEVFYEAELAAIRAARHSVNLEAYIFEEGEVGRRFLEALTDRARAGVRVSVVVDAIGSFTVFDSYFRELRDAGGRVAWYHPFKWYTLPRMNNRTHRELITIDGKVGFIGGAGFADHWLIGQKRHRRWRDTMVRVEGDAVLGLQASFAENWLEAYGEILTGNNYFPFCEVEHETVALIVNSSPSAGRSTRARMLFQTLLASAQESILITTPYFLPDRSARDEMVRAIRERGVETQIITPSEKSDHLLTRRSSRRLYGELLEAGARIYEYEPGMIHAKSMVIDKVWSVVGSTNFDNRSFGLNDEVNLAAFDRELASRITEDFVRDRAESHEISFEQWRRRSILEQAHEQLGRFLERQQ